MSYPAISAAVSFKASEAFRNLPRNMQIALEQTLSDMLARATEWDNRCAVMAWPDAIKG